MINLTKEEKMVLHSKMGARQEFYRLEVLDHTGTHKFDMPFKGGDISVNADYEVKKSATVTLMSVEGIDLMRDKISIHMGIWIDDAIRWWNLGIFRIMKASGRVLQLADETIVLQQDRLLEKKVFYKGSLYTDALKWFLISAGITFFDIQASALTLPADIICDDTKSKLAWFNHIADQINYLHLYVAGNGYFTSKKYQEPRFDNVGYTYNMDKTSVITNASADIDMWNVPNVFKRVVSRGDMPTLVSVFVNDNPTNKFSTTYRGMQITDIQSVDLIGSQEELDLLVSRVARKAMQLEEILKIDTSNMPHHEIYDIIQVNDELYEETSYNIDLSTDGKMSHYLRRVVYDDTRPQSL